MISVGRMTKIINKIMNVIIIIFIIIDGMCLVFIEA